MTYITDDHLTKYGGIDYANGASFRLLEGTRLGDSISALEGLFRRWRARSRERRELASTSVRELADMGISIPQAKYEAGKPFWKN